MKIFFALIPASVFLFLQGSLVVFAEGDTICSGSIMGMSSLGNINVGQTSFDSHLGDNPSDNVQVSLGIVGLADGLAPNNREYAACSNKQSGNHDGGANNSGAYEYALKGWAWNTNLGFISFNCQGGKNIAGSGGGLDCGNINYGVYVGSPVLPGGQRDLFGHAWSPAFGWIQFKGKTSANVPYGVKIDANGNSSGYAWTEAGIYMNLSGLKIQLPDSDQPLLDQNSGEDWCEGKPWICLEVVPNPSTLKPDPNKDSDGDGIPDSFDPDADGDGILDSIDANITLGIGDGIKIADGVDGYYVHLYLKDDQGNPLDPGNPSYNFVEFVDSISLQWDDTVKLKQASNDTVCGLLKKADANCPGFDNLKTPYQTTKKAGIIWKPLKFVDFEPVQNDPGHYISDSKIKSYAPTSESNVSFTTSTNPPLVISNEQFIEDVGATQIVEKNQLVLKSIIFEELIHAENGVVLPQGAVYPNGKIGLVFKFKPAINVNTLYAGALQDVISAYRSLPSNIKFGLINLGSLPDSVLNSASVHLSLAYSIEKTKAQSGCADQDDDDDDDELDEVANDFDFHFLQDPFEGNLNAQDISNVKPSKKNLPSKKIKNFFNTLLNLPIVASLPAYEELDEEEKDSVLPCAVAAAPTFYTKITYDLDGNNVYDVLYYGNKLPRIAGGQVFNPIAVVQGSLVGQLVSDVLYGNVVQTSGSVNITTVRDTINENLKKQVGEVNVSGDPQLCTVTKLGANKNDFTVANCSSSLYKIFDVGNEHVLYFKGQNVRLDLTTGSFSGKWVLISDEGNIFIDSDLYNADTDDKSLALVAFRDSADFFATGNVYLGPCSADLAGPKNIQATILADGTVFPYNGDIPENDQGEPEFAGFEERIAKSKCQLVIEGAIYSDNTIGGADLDKGDNPKDYLLLGGGKILKLPLEFEQRMKAQYYDLNYLRLFTLGLKTGDNGCPIDQKCGKALCADDIIMINNGQKVCGEYEPCNPNSNNEEVKACDGINPFAKFMGAGSDGDLVVNISEELLAKNLNNDPDSGTDFKPVYIIQRDFAKGSFIFSKVGGTSLAN